MAIAPARTMGELFTESVAARKYQTYLASAFALSALLLVSLGIFGVISFTVARRIPEIGIRMALGARKGQLMALIIRQSMIPVVLGLLVGLACAMSVSHVIGSQLYGVTPNDPIVFGAVTSTLALAVLSICACWIPACRVTQIDPVVALRFDWCALSR